MKKFTHFERSVAPQPRRRQGLDESCCGSEALCFRCSMIALTSYRFTMFSKKFGRMPGPDDELFFDETQTYPVRASKDAIKSQIFDAAEARGLNFFILLSCLGLNSPAVFDQRPL